MEQYLPAIVTYALISSLIGLLAATILSEEGEGSGRLQFILGSIWYALVWPVLIAVWIVNAIEGN